MTRAYKHTDEEDTRLVALLTTLQTTERRREVLAGLPSSTLKRLRKRFGEWEERFPDGRINSALIREELRGREHAEMSLAVLEEVIAGTDAKQRAI